MGICCESLTYLAARSPHIVGVYRWVLGQKGWELLQVICDELFFPPLVFCVAIYLIPTTGMMTLGILGPKAEWLPL